MSLVCDAGVEVHAVLLFESPKNQFRYRLAS